MCFCMLLLNTWFHQVYLWPKFLFNIFLLVNRSFANSLHTTYVNNQLIMLIYSTWSFLEGSVDTSSLPLFVMTHVTNLSLQRELVETSKFEPPPKKKRAKNTKQFPQTAMKLRETSTHLSPRKVRNKHMLLRNLVVMNPFHGFFEKQTALCLIYQSSFSYVWVGKPPPPKTFWIIPFWSMWQHRWQHNIIVNKHLDYMQTKNIYVYTVWENVYIYT